ncbi:MAG: hypothetical protein IBV53_07020 [Candidatus Atribacteria bacterium]
MPSKIAQLFKRFLGSKSRIIIKSSKVGEVIQYVADISKVQRVLEYQPKCSS